MTFHEIIRRNVEYVCIDLEIKARVPPNCPEHNLDAREVK
jgi:hypothetical protein